MFKATMTDGKVFRDIIECVAAMLDEAFLYIDPDIGLKITGMDLSHIALIDLTLKKEDFDVFESTEEYNLGIKMEDLVKLLRRGSAKDAIILSHNPREKKISVGFQRDGSKKRREFKLALIDIEGEQCNTTSLQAIPYINTCSIPMEYLIESLKDGEMFGEILMFTIKDSILITTENNVGDMEYEIDKDELTNVEFSGESEGIFAIRYLKNIYKVKALAKSIMISFLSENPLKIEANILTDSQLIYYLSPRVDTDDDMMEED